MSTDSQALLLFGVALVASWGFTILVGVAIGEHIAKRSLLKRKGDVPPADAL